MADQILSQEEIDALLSAVNRGEVDIETDKEPEVEVTPYDLTSQNIMLRDQFEMLEEIYHRFGNFLRPTVSSLLRKAVEINYASTEMVKYTEFLKNFSEPTNFYLFSMEPLFGRALIAVEPDFGFMVIDCMLGGKGKPINQVREFTLIEQRIMKRFIASLLKELEKSWEKIYSLRIEVKKTETKPKFVQLASPSDLVIVAVFSIEGENEFSGNLYLCVPYLMLDPIKEKLTYKSLRDESLEKSRNYQIQNLLRDMEVKVYGEIGSAVYTVRNLINLQTGDIIRLKKGPQDPIIVRVENTPKYLGFPGVIKGNRAVQITKLLRKKKTEETDGKGSREPRG